MEYDFRSPCAFHWHCCPVFERRSVYICISVGPYTYLRLRTMLVYAILTSRSGIQLSEADSLSGVCPAPKSLFWAFVLCVYGVYPVVSHYIALIAAVSVDAIPVGTHYLGPTFADATPCRCSTVTYSLLSACAGCQNRDFTNWINWSLNCPYVEISTYV
jgi:hypothetical protein